MNPLFPVKVGRKATMILLAFRLSLVQCVRGARVRSFWIGCKLLAAGASCGDLSTPSAAPGGRKQDPLTAQIR